MYRSPDLSDELRRLAALQSGVLTAEQARALGFGRHSQQRMIDQHRWQRLGTGILLTYDHPPTWNALAWGGVLRGGDSARLGGLAAAHEHRLIDRPPDAIVILIPHGIRRQCLAPWMFVRERPGARQSRTIGSLPRTVIEDTVLDLCEGRFGDGPNQSPLHWLTSAVQKGLTTPERLMRVADSRPRLNCRRELRDLLTDVADGAQSPLEVRYRRDVEVPHGLPAGVRQASAPSGGRGLYRDVRYERFGVLVELDGKTGHTGMDRFRDFRRDNAALLDGEVTLRYGWLDLDNEPCGVALQVAEMLTRGGWDGLFQTCGRCAAMIGSGSAAS